MRTWWIFKVTNDLGFAQVISEYAQSKNEALKMLINDCPEYCAKIDFLGTSFSYGSVYNSKWNEQF